MLPDGMLTVTITADYAHPSGAPLQGTVYLKPRVNVTRSSTYGLIVLNATPMPLSTVGTATATVLNPWDSTISPGGEDGSIWQYFVREVYVGGPTITYFIDIPEGLADGAVINLADVTRIDEQFIETSATSSTTIVVGPQGPEGPTGPTGPQGPQGDPGADGMDGATTPVWTVSDMLAEDPFYIAHRGSGVEFPEHTMAAYETCVAVARRNDHIPIIEVSCNMTADGITVCLHDATLDRTTNSTGAINDQLYAAIKNTVLAEDSQLYGAGWQGQELSTLRAVLDRFLGKAVIFLEPKDSESFEVVRDMLLYDYPNSSQSVVYKRFFSDPTHAEMKGLGFTTWGYTDISTTPAEMDAEEANIDLWGIPYQLQDAEITAVVARGKPVVAFNMQRRHDVDRVVALGVQGLMASQYVYLTRTATGQQSMQFLTQDDFATQVKSIGNIPPGASSPSSYPLFDAEDDIYFPSPSFNSMLMGSLNILPNPSSYTIYFDMKWETVPANVNTQSGIALAKEDDQTYITTAENPTGGYHFVIRADGRIQLYRHEPEVTSGTQLITQNTEAPVNDTWMSFEVSVTPTDITIRRTDVGPYTGSTSDTTYRDGSYFHVTVGSVSSSSERPHWRNMRQEAD